LRADLEEAEIAHRRDAAAARADLDHVDGGNEDRKAAARLEAIDAVDLEVADHERRAILDDARLRRGATHVEGEQPIEAEHFRAVSRRQRTRRRAGLHHTHRKALRDVDADHAAVRQHDERIVHEAALLQPVAQRVEIRPGDGRRVGVHRDRRGARIFADLWRHVGRDRDVELRRALCDDVADRALVRRVEVRVEQRDRDRDDAIVLESIDQRLDLLRIDRLDHLAGRERALGDAERHLARDQRLGKLDLRIEHLVAMLVADGEDVAEALGDEQSSAGSLALDDRIGDDGRRVHQHIGDGSGRDAGGLQHGVQRGEEPDFQAFGRGQGLVDPGPAGTVAQHDIGERSADIDGQRVVGHAGLFPRVCFLLRYMVSEILGPSVAAVNRRWQLTPHDMLC
jgi:hypothetical protein